MFQPVRRTRIVARFAQPRARSLVLERDIEIADGRLEILRCFVNIISTSS